MPRLAFDAAMKHIQRAIAAGELYPNAALIATPSPPSQPSVFDAVSWYVEGEITERTRGNVAMPVDGRW